MLLLTSACGIPVMTTPISETKYVPCSVDPIIRASHKDTPGTIEQIKNSNVIHDSACQ